VIYLIYQKGVVKMRILIMLPSNSKQALIVRLHTDELVKEVKRLIGKRKHTQAMVKAIVSGKFEKEVGEDELPGIDADLILSENTACWDLTK